jgi:hypothetical protein
LAYLRKSIFKISKKKLPGKREGEQFNGSDKYSSAMMLYF